MPDTPTPAPAAASDDPLFDAGTAVRRAVLGDAHVDRSVTSATAFTRDFQDYLTRHVWGAVWTRPGLTRRERSIVTLSVLSALARAEEITLHVRGALNNGLTAEEISEVLLHTAAYAGAPAANTAFAAARRTLEQIALEQGSPG